MMKKAILLLLVLMLCILFPACDRKGQQKAAAEMNPVAGVWEIKTADREQTFTFAETDKGTEGSYTYYDYADSSWGEFTFTVKEQTDCSLILLIDDGTMDEMHYKVLGDRLYLDGVVYTNNTADVPTLPNIRSFAMMYEGEDYPVYENLFMGIHAEDVKDVLKMPWSLQDGFRNDNYSSWFTCDYQAEINIKDGVYYYMYLGFDSGNRLVHITKQGRYEQDSFDALTDALTQKFGQPECDQHIYAPDNADAERSVVDTLTWVIGEYVIQVKSSTKEGESTPDYFTECYYYNPN